MSPRFRPRLLLADGHAMLTDGLRSLLEPDYVIAGIVTDGIGLIKAARTLKPDVVVFEISLAQLNGLDAIREILRLRPATRAVALTMHADRTYLTDAFDAGVTGFVAKQSGSGELRTALRAVLRGATYVSRSIGGGVPPAPGKAAGARKLTPRQRQVLQLVAEGRTVKMIARSLVLSPKTVEFHKYRMMRDLGATTTAALIQYAVEHGLAGTRE